MGEIVLTKVMKVPATRAGLIGSLVLLLGIVSRPLGGFLRRHMGIRPLFIGSLLMIALGCLSFVPSTISLASALAGVVLVGIGIGLPYAAMFSRAGALFPGRAAAAMGFVNMLGILMILGGAPLVGHLKDLTGTFKTSFIFLAGFSLLVCAMVPLIDREDPATRATSRLDAALCFGRQCYSALTSELCRFPSRHFLGHEEQQFPVAFIGAAEKLAKFLEQPRFLARAAPGDFSCALALKNVGQGRRLVAVVEELVQGNFESAGKFLDGLQSRNGVSVFHAGNIAPQQSRALFNFSLRKFLFFAKRPQVVPNDHFFVLSELAYSKFPVILRTMSDCMSNWINIVSDTALSTIRLSAPYSDMDHIPNNLYQTGSIGFNTG